MAINVLSFVGAAAAYHVASRFLAGAMFRRAGAFLASKVSFLSSWIQNVQGTKQSIIATNDDVKLGLRKIRSKSKHATPAETPADTPEELRDAIAHLATLPPHLQRHVYAHWREQAKAHATIYRDAKTGIEPPD
ncbi:MAG: hypothetical protein ACLQVD_08330 [Capsulimonadaceae bacterium]